MVGEDRIGVAAGETKDPEHNIPRALRSTVLRLLLRFWQPTGGTIRINNIPIESIALTELRRRRHRNIMIANHPEREQIRLENVLFALGNPLRLEIIRILADGSEQSCNALRHEDVAKSTMTHHWRVLRDSGVIWQRPQGRENLISLRREDLDARFPGLLDTLLNVMVREG